VAVIEDISQQKQAEESQAQLAALVTSSDDAIFSRNLDGIITSWNQAAEMLYGYHAEEVIGKPVSLLIPPDRQEEAPAIRERVNRGEAIRHFETVRLRKDGRLVDVSLTMSPMKDASGTVIGGSTIARDITERKRAEKERAKLLAREQAARAKAAAAEEANRLKSQFLANMSHELRTPLHAIIGFAEMMYDERAGPVSDTYKDFLGEILDGSRHLLQLINDLLDLSKIEAGKMELVPTRVDVDAAAAHVIESLRPLSGPKRITVVCDVEPPVTVVETDERQLKQIFYNYLSNAIKYTPDEGTVTVRVREADGDRFRIEVEDTGVGIASEHLPKLFHDFQQLDSSTGKRQQGTGLGLALIKRIVEAQGGRAGVSSVVDQGSCFYAELPRRLLPG
jgi:PAS domain S-box-containing protein